MHRYGVAASFTIFDPASPLSIIPSRRRIFKEEDKEILEKKSRSTGTS